MQTRFTTVTEGGFHTQNHLFFLIVKPNLEDLVQVFFLLMNFFINRLNKNFH